MNGDDGARVAHDAERWVAVQRNRAARRGPRRSLSAVPLNRSVVQLAAAALALAGCTGPTAPVGSVPGSTVTPTATTSSPPAVPEPTKPPEKPTPDSAIAFVSYFWDLYNYAYQTYDTKPLEAISDKSCTFCLAIASDVRRIGNLHSVVEGYEASLLVASSPPTKITAGTLVIGRLSQKAGKLQSTDGSATALQGFRSIRSTTALRWDGSRWHIGGVTNETRTRKPWNG